MGTVEIAGKGAVSAPALAEGSSSPISPSALASPLAAAAAPSPVASPPRAPSSLEPGPDETLDALFRGRLRLLQPRRGARVTLDPLLLADFARRDGRRLGRVLDLGSGGGVIALALALGDPGASFVGVELQPAFVELARRNAVLNGLAARVAFAEGDFRAPATLPLAPQTFDLVVANPPYATARGGQRAPRTDRALARQELAGSLDDVVATARRFLRPRGRLALVFPAARLAELLGSLDRAGLRPRTLRTVHSVADQPARRVLVEAVRDYRGGVVAEPPLVVHEADRRRFAPEVQRIVEGAQEAGPR